MQTVPIPQTGSLPLPGPVWLFTVLLVVSLTLHLAAMNSALGGGIWALWNYFRGRHAEHPNSRRLASELALMLPNFLAFTVTLGVAALLFVQVLFGNFFYTSSILIGVLWLAVIPLLIAAYYGFYYFSYTSEKGRGMSGFVLAISFCVLLGVAFVYVNNMALMQSPERWQAMYRAHPNGWNLNVGDRSVIPRYLHIVNGAIALFSAILAHFGMRKLKADLEYGRWIVQRSAMVFAACTGLQFLFGMWMLMAIPRHIAIVLLQDPLAVTVFGMALMSAVAAMLLILLGSFAEKNNAMVHAGFGMSLVTLFLMVCLRYLLRMIYLKPYANLGALAVSPQNGVIALFMVLFLGGLATVGYMLRLVARSGKTRISADGPN
ncbi:MAG: hypothetical protein CXZ00_06810 [Acidobacteria bacterium]|nr:MAG: hypothetical protein CXZ00_06810 [Acidobacteriota bacterium]